MVSACHGCIKRRTNPTKHSLDYNLFQLPMPQIHPWVYFPPPVLRVQSIFNYIHLTDVAVAAYGRRSDEREGGKNSNLEICWFVLVPRVQGPLRMEDYIQNKQTSNFLGLVWWSSINVACEYFKCWIPHRSSPVEYASPFWLFTLS